jgi:hypothetical protein
LLSLAVDCNDVPPAGSSINPGATEVPGNGIDDDCDATTSDSLGEYTISIKSMSPVDYDSWEPKPGDTLTVEFTVYAPDGVTEVTTTEDPETGDKITSDFEFTLAPPPPYPHPLQRNPTNYDGLYHNDPRPNSTDDFTYSLPSNVNPMELTCNDYGAWIEVHATVSIERGNGTPIDLQRDFTFPKDSDRDGLGNFWEDLYGDLNPGDDLELDPLGDGLKVIDEYRGSMWGELLLVDPNVPANTDPDSWVVAAGLDPANFYDTPSYVPEQTVQGLVKHIRTSPRNRDLFVKFVGFDQTWPFAIGEGFHRLNPPVDVHALGEGLVSTLPAGSDEYKIDMATVELVEGTYNPIPGQPQYAQSGHIVKRAPRDWTFMTTAVSSYGGDENYGASLELYKKTIYDFFHDKPYYDYTTLAPGGNKGNQADWLCAGTYNLDGVCIGENVGDGLLEPSTSCEDKNDDADIDGGENRSGNDRLDGDLLVKNLPDNPVYSDGSITWYGADIDGDGKDDEWDYRFQLSPFNIGNNNDPLVGPTVEIPQVTRVEDINPLYENALAQAISMFVTHELGHYTGVTFHTGDSLDAMFEETNNLVRDGHFSQTAADVIRIHNK